jgi:signal transduction histidine kinase
VGNAVKHGVPDAPIDVLVHDRGSFVVLEVHNWGNPIPPEMLPVIFDPFRRGCGPQVAHTEGAGLGLGLYITREIVAAHGGEIEVSSSDEEGTLFRVRLPRGLATGREEVQLPA